LYAGAPSFWLLVAV